MAPIRSLKAQYGVTLRMTCRLRVCDDATCSANRPQIGCGDLCRSAPLGRPFERIGASGETDRSTVKSALVCCPQLVSPASEQHEPHEMKPGQIGEITGHPCVVRHERDELLPAPLVSAKTVARVTQGL